MSRKQRVVYDWTVGDWIPEAEWEAKQPADLNTALRHGRCPYGLRVIPSPEPYGVSAKHQNPLVHKVVRVVEGWARDRETYAAAYECGDNSFAFKPVADPEVSRQCRKCFPVAAKSGPVRVYGYWAADGTPLYIGQTADLEKRRQHHRKHAPWLTESYWHDVISTHDTRAEAVAAEAATIRRLSPRYNVVHNRRAAA